MKNPRRLAALAALCGTVALAGWVAAELAGLGSSGIESSADRSQSGNICDRPRRARRRTPGNAPGEDSVPVADMASGSAALSDPPPMLRPATPPASLSTPDPVRNEVKEAACSVEVADMGSGAPLCPTLIRCRGPRRYPCCSRR